MLDYEPKVPMSVEFSLGAYLRAGRERAGLPVNAVSSACRITPQFLHALEADRFDLLPAPVYVRGFIRAYCQQVGLDADAALRIYEPTAAATPGPPRPAPSAPARPSRARRWHPAVAGAAALIALGAAITFVVVRGRQPDAVASRGSSPTGMHAPEPGPARVSPAPGSPVTATREPGPPPVEDASSTPAPSGALPASAPPPRAHVLVVRAVDTTWVRVAPEGASVTEETLPAGAVREWRSTGRFRVSVGNAGGIEMELDGRPMPALGQRGQVVHTTIPEEARR
jgi:cytoskeleton protein RodZ